MAFGTTPISTTSLSTNQFPVSAVYVQGTSGGNLTALQGGPVSSADGSGNVSAPAAIYVPDGNNIALGASTDAAGHASVIGQLKQIQANTASVTIGSLPANASVNVAQVAGTTTDTNTGNASAGTQRVVLASNQPAVPASQSGTWNITNISGTISLPTGAATAAKQPALGTAGSASADVLTVQGIASMTALKVDGSGVTQPVSGTVTANAGTGTFNIQQTNITADYDTSAGTQNLTMFGLALPASGGAVAGGTSSNPVRVDPTGTTTQPVSGTVSITANSSVNVAQLAGTTTDTNSGNKSAGTLRVVLATDQPALTNALKVDGSAVTQPVSGTITANIGTTNGLALDSSVNGLLLSQGSTTSGEKGPLVQGAVTTNAPSYTTAQTSPLSLDTSGLLRASLKDTPSNTNNLNVNLAASAATVTVTATNLQTNVAQFGGTNVVTGTGAGGSGIPRVTVSSDSTVGSNSATGSAVPANAFYEAGIAKTALPTAASDGNLTGAMVDKFGRQIVVPETVRDLKSNIPGLTLSSGTETTLIAAVASQLSDITGIICINTSASAVRVDFRDSTGGTIQFALYLPAGDTRGFSGMMYKQTTANNNWTAQLSSAVTDVRIYGTYVKNG